MNYWASLSTETLVTNYIRPHVEKYRLEKNTRMAALYVHAINALIEHGEKPSREILETEHKRLSKQGFYVRAYALDAMIEKLYAK